MSDSPNGGSEDVPEVHGQPRNWLQPFLLLSLEQWQSHGYELIRRLSIFGFEAVDPGSVYRTLRHLERDGLVESDWDTTVGPARRRYSVTDAGRIYLEGWAGTLRVYQYMLDQFFDTYPGERPDEREGTNDVPEGGALPEKSPGGTTRAQRRTRPSSAPTGLASPDRRADDPRKRDHP